MRILVPIAAACLAACTPRESTRAQQERWYNVGRIDALESVYLEKMAKHETGGDIAKQ